MIGASFPFGHLGSADAPSGLIAFTGQGVLSYLSDEIDLTVPQTIELVRPVGFRMTTILALAWFVSQKNGTITTGPTAQAGTDSSIANLAPSTLQAALTGTAVNNRQTFVGAVTANNLLDLSAFGIRARITAGATLGTATIFKARLGGVIGVGRL